MKKEGRREMKISSLTYFPFSPSLESRIPAQIVLHLLESQKPLLKQFIVESGAFLGREKKGNLCASTERESSFVVHDDNSEAAAN